jgi:hypothetical protein
LSALTGDCQREIVSADNHLAWAFPEVAKSSGLTQEIVRSPLRIWQITYKLARNANFSLSPVPDGIAILA